MYPDEVWRRINDEPDGGNHGLTSHESFTDAMHSVHHPTLRVQDDGKAIICGEYERAVFGNAAACRRLPMRIPVRPVDFSQRGEGHVYHSQPGRKRYQAPHVPRKKPCG